MWANSVPRASSVEINLDLEVADHHPVYRSTWVSMSSKDSKEKGTKGPEL